MSDDERYNGWTNRETWCVHLWLSNDQGTDEMARELVAGFIVDEDGEPAEGGELQKYEAADALQSMVDEMAGELINDQASFVADLLGYALAQVNWIEIAEAFAPDA